MPIRDSHRGLWALPTHPEIIRFLEPRIRVAGLSEAGHRAVGHRHWVPNPVLLVCYSTGQNHAKIGRLGRIHTPPEQGKQIDANAGEWPWALLIRFTQVRILPGVQKVQVEALERSSAAGHVHIRGRRCSRERTRSRLRGSARPPKGLGRGYRHRSSCRQARSAQYRRLS